MVYGTYTNIEALSFELFDISAECNVFDDYRWK